MHEANGPILPKKRNAYLEPVSNPRYVAVLSPTEFRLNMEATGSNGRVEVVTAVSRCWILMLNLSVIQGAGEQFGFRRVWPLDGDETQTFCALSMRNFPQDYGS